MHGTSLKEKKELTEGWRFVAMLLVAFCYFSGDLLGLSLAFEKSKACPVAPAAGVGLGALLLLGKRAWPGIFLGAFVASFVALRQAALPGFIIAVSASMAVCKTLEGLLGFWLYKRWIASRNLVNRPEDVFRFGLLAMLMSLVGAVGGPLILGAAGVVRWDNFLQVGLTWWLGNLTGLIIITPITTFSQRQLRFPWTPWRTTEALLAGLALVVVSIATFHDFGLGWDWKHLRYFLLAPMLWIAFRFGRRATVLGFIVYASIASWGALSSRVPFESLPPAQALLSLQAFLAFTGLTALVIAASVGERKDAAESFRLVVEAAPNGIVMVDTTGKITLVNAQMERLFGYTRQEMVGQPIELLIPERFRSSHPGLRKDFSVHPKARPMGAGRDLYGRRKDATEFPVEIGLNPTRTSQGLAVLASIIDITARKAAEAALRQSEERFRVIAETVPSLLFTATPEGLCDYASKSFQDYTGMPLQELLGLRWLKALHPDDVEATRERWGHVLEAGEWFRVEYRFRRRDGEYHWFLGEAHPVRDETGHIVKWVGALTDIHQEKQARALLEQTVEERTAALQSSLSSMQELLYTIAHDLRAPNRTMKGFAQLLELRAGDKLDEVSRDYLRRISAAAERNDILISDLLDYGRLSHAPVPLAPVDARQAVDAVLRTLDTEIQQHHAHIHLGQEWPPLLANEPLLEQILVNLLSNALKFVPPEKEPEIVISAGRENGKVIVRVKDNGVGIVPDQKEKIFQPFMRLPSAVEVPGTGMGLAIVKKAAERMHGKVGFESTPGEGSCFWLELPATQERTND